jgi:hypothetical protein
MSAFFTYRFDNQGERKPEFCAVIMHIGKEIRKVMDEKGVKPTWLAQQINTTRRNMYDMLKRSDLSVSVLAEISKKLDFNFFSLYNDQLLIANEYSFSSFSLLLINLFDSSQHVFARPGAIRR